MTHPDSSHARDLLQQATQLTRNSAAFSPAWLAYIFFCAAGSMYAATAAVAVPANVVGANVSAELFPLVVAGVWFLAGMTIVVISVVMSQPVRHGFGKRWIIMMVLWAALWVLTVWLAPVLMVWQSLALIGPFIALAVAGPMWELASVRKEVRP